MDSYADERDERLLEKEPYTFFVLRRVIGGDCQLLLSDHEGLIICYTGRPYPVWIFTEDGLSASKMEQAYRLVSEHDLLVKDQRFNVKYAFAEFFIRRAAQDGRKLSISTNMYAYDCLNPVRPSVSADGGIHLCTEADMDELIEFLDLFHSEIGIDGKDAEGYRVEAKALIDAGSMYLWKNAEGTSVASCRYGPNVGMASLNLVYTRPEHRRKHYAENLVYEVTLNAKKAGYIPMLYTDADYAASNACYEKIGYELRGKLCTVAVKS